MNKRQAAIALLLFTCLRPAAHAIQPAELVADVPRGSIVLEADRLRCLHIEAWFATSSEEQRQGLMFVEQMDEFEGMLFIYPQSARISMWMKNTLISLDMLFIDADGQIVNIAARTTPLSTRSIAAAAPVTRVLELNAGFAQRWRLVPGNRLLQAEAVSGAEWPTSAPR
jgi:uncharacterized membrane protein (UPF0127 family)